MHHIFLADIHLGAFHEEKNKQLEESLIQLIDYCEENSIQIHLLGDLFDYWMEYENYTPPLGKTVLSRFRIYNEKFNSFYITGNHDFWTRGHFTDLGFNIKTEHASIDLDGKCMLMFHGDGLSDDTFQLSRPFLNDFIRKPGFVRLFQSIFDGEAGNHFMKEFSEFTRDENDMNPEHLSRWAKNYLSESHYDVIITGHDHLPRMETYNHGIYINPGAFHQHLTVIQYTNKAFKLVVWSNEEHKLVPFADQPEEIKFYE